MGKVPREGGKREKLPQIDGLTQKYGDKTLVALMAFESDASARDSENFPGDSDRHVKYEPTVRGRPWHPDFMMGGSRYPPPGSELRQWNGRNGSIGHVKYGPYPGDRPTARDAVLRMNRNGIDWADKKIFKKTIFGFASWTNVVAFASKDLFTIFAHIRQDGQLEIVEFESDDNDDASILYSTARLAFPGPEYSNIRRIESPGCAWRAVGPHWGNHWWVWNGYNHCWIVRYLFERDEYAIPSA